MIIPLFMPGHWEILIIVLVVLLLFGGRKIPEMMRGLGSGIKEFKKGVRDEEDEQRSIPEGEEKSRQTQQGQQEEKQ
jgi:sec-independent protein translocase protein TatA